MEYFNLKYWNDYKLEDRPIYGIPDYRLMRLLDEVAIVVEENNKLKEALDYLVCFQGIPQALKDKALEMAKVTTESSNV